MTFIKHVNLPPNTSILTLTDSDFHQLPRGDLLTGAHSYQPIVMTAVMLPVHCVLPMHYKSLSHSN